MDKNSNRFDRLYDIIIVGAGASGLFAAASCPVKVNGAIMEKEAQAGQKLLATGNGQCNLTHGGSIKDFLFHYGNRGKELRSVLYSHNNVSLRSFVESLGVPMMEREDGKVFPRSLSARDVREKLLAAASQNGFSVKLGAMVTGLVPPSSQKPFWSVIWDGSVFRCNAVIVSTGGLSYPHTGSDGNFLPALEELGLRIVPPAPALAPIFVEDYPYGELSGLSLPGVRVFTGKDGHLKFRHTGDLLLTHTCFSGPAALHLARYVEEGSVFAFNYFGNAVKAKNRNATDRDSFHLDLVKSLKIACVGNKSFISTVLQSVTGLPKRFLESICLRLGIDSGQRASGIFGRDLERISSLLAEDRFTVRSVGSWNTAMATKGGVALSEISLKTMEAINYPGLYITGEALDVDGDTGGYNLQFAYSSGAAAIKDAVK